MLTKKGKIFAAKATLVFIVLGIVGSLICGISSENNDIYVSCLVGLSAMLVIGLGFTIGYLVEYIEKNS